MTKKRNILQIQYALSQFLFWVTCCACSGFVAVYLQYKGLSDTLVGMVVGIYCFLALFAQPLTAKIVTLIPFLTVKKMICILMGMMAAMFAIITFWQVPLLVVLILFIALNAISCSVNPMINTFGMEYVNQNRPINFGLARGIGSMGWAVTAMVLGLLLERFSPEVLGYVYIVVAILMIVLLASMEDMGQLAKRNAAATSAQKKQRGILRDLVTDPMILWVAVGLFFLLCCHSIGTTFTINIVRNVGGSEFAAGMAQFFGAGSELLGMMVFSILIKRMNSVRILKICSLFFVLRFLVLTFAPNIPLVLCTYAMQGPSTGLYVPAAVYLVNDRLPLFKQTQGQSVFYMISGGLAGCIGNLAGGWLQDSFGLHTALLVCVISSVIGSVCIFSRSEKDYVARF